jgi:hypothetical protein
MLLRIFIAIIVVALAASQATAAIVIINDSFSDGGRTNGVDPNDAAWFQNNSGDTASVVNDANAVVNGNFGLSYNAAGTFRGAVAPFPSVTLGAVGSVTEAISLSFDFRMRSTTAATNGFRFYLGNSLGSPYTADGSTTPAGQADDIGLGSRFNIGATPSSLAIVRDGGPPAGSGLLGINETYSTLSSNTFSINDQLAHSALLLIRRTSPTTVEVTATVYDSPGLTGTVLATVTHGGITEAEAGLFTFNQAAIGIGGTANNFSIDNVLVQHPDVIPEPSTLGLLASALAGGVFWLRRRW